MRDPCTCTVFVLSAWGTGHKLQQPCYYMKHCLPSRPHFVSVELPYRHANTPMRQIISVQAGTVTVQGQRATSHAPPRYSALDVEQTAQLYFDKWNSPSLEASCVCASLLPDFLYGFSTCRCRCACTTQHAISSSSTVSNPH